ncbi:class I SAM-dependent methyltransferase [Paenarthrobacter nitroguajacolicus]|uniref:class I SAM-dependent methyltransferase n=1 Tax=Paenarthrobacter nitroguajacolicus TaxID=211146 RepID=UPI00248BCDF6|nr:class I SAM-dependent methyltransferase [Paenarthrobacter nitroguajacolicus]MDI2035124.1 Cypemycin N-terminal methyltransferase [Paenarthrobacter nitroguajacolicus]
MPPELSPAQLSALYDVENQWAEDDDFFLGFVNEWPNSRVLDLGCGTGRISLALAAHGHSVVGIDPNPGSLAAARGKRGAEAVTWVEGTSTRIPKSEVFDVAIMTAHVAQAIHDDGEWSRTLADIHRALAPGGRLAFDSRDPAARAWERWTPTATQRRHILPDGTAVETWMDSHQPAAGVVTLTEYRVHDESSVETETSVLAFRTEARLRQDLGAAGFTVEGVHGGWAGESVGSGQGELIVLARKPR